MAIARISHLSLRAPVGGVRREMAVKIGAEGVDAAGTRY